MYYDDSHKRRALGTMAALAGLLAVGIGFAFYGPQYQIANPFNVPANASLPIDNADYLYSVAQKSFQDGDPSYAAGIARRVLMVNHNHIGAMKILTAVALQQRDYPEAFARSNAILQLKPEDATARLALARCWTETHQIDKARDVLRAMISDKRCTFAERSAAATALEATGETVPPGAFADTLSPSPAQPTARPVIP